MNDYDDEIEAIDDSLSSAMEIVAGAKRLLHQGLVLPASNQIPIARKQVRDAEAYIQNLYKSLEWEAKQ